MSKRFFLFNKYNKNTRKINPDTTRQEITNLPLVGIKDPTKGIIKHVRMVGYFLKVFYYIEQNDLTSVKKTNIKNFLGYG